SWREPASFPDRGEAFCSSPNRSMSKPPISTARRCGKARRDRRNTRMDPMGAGRAFAVRDVATGAQVMTILQAIALALRENQCLAVRPTLSGAEHQMIRPHTQRLLPNRQNPSTFPLVLTRRKMF